MADLEKDSFIEESLEKTRDYPSEILSEIHNIYPFLSKQEHDNFEAEVKRISTDDPLQKIKEMLELLNNPHTRVIESVDNYLERKDQLDERYRPTSKIIDNTLYLKIPTFSGLKLKNIEDVFLNYYENTEGLIIDLRDNMGGDQTYGQQFSEKYLIKPGRHECGINITRSPKNSLLKEQMYVSSNNEQYYNKPVVILTNDKTFSSSERIVALLKAGTDCTIIGSDTKGGSAYPTETLIEINSKKYIIKIPRWRFILPGQQQPLEVTKIHPDIEYTKEDIVDFSVSYIKNKAREKP
jgi:C-terminal processing protease CtpA/Prc